MFGFLVCGNVLDNVNVPRNLAIALQISLSVSYLVIGLEAMYAKMKTKCFMSLLSDEKKVLPEMISAGIVLINML